MFKHVYLQYKNEAIMLVLFTYIHPLSLLLYDLPTGFVLKLLLIFCHSSLT